MKLINIFFLMVFIALLFTSCDEDNINPNNESKYIELDRTLSVVPDRIQFSKDQIYHFKIAFDTNYLKEDGFIATGYFINGSGSLEMKLYDDGISDDSLRNDLAASNNIWSGGINALDFPFEGNWNLKLEYTMNDSIFLGSENFGVSYVVKNSILVIEEVTGLAGSQIFESGFDTKTIQVNVTDSNNLIIPYDKQDLRFQLFNSTGVLLKENTYKRPNINQDFIFNIDSTYAAGISFARNYRMRLTTTDLYDASATIEYTNITIRNGAPSLYNLQYPDTVFIPDVDSLYFSVKVNVNDPQGHLEYQDIDEVVITVNSYDFLMRDDGNENFYPYNSGDLLKNDGVYTATFKVKSTNAEAVYPISIQVTDKVGNASAILSGQFIFVKNSKISVKRRNDENSFNYINPFDHL